jgi:hypothetical protein
MNRHPNERKLFESEMDAEDVGGHYVPFGPNNQPVLMNLPGNPHRWVMVFSTIAKLEAAMADMGITDHVCKYVEDGLEFIQSVLETGVRIALDPYRVKGEDKTRWTEITLQNAPDTPGLTPGTCPGGLSSSSSGILSRSLPLVVTALTCLTSSGHSASLTMMVQVSHCGDDGVPGQFGS